ncbi:MAG: hypothetical protein N2517_09020 [Ignavibacteria bacterium]|nr:hypothetical protein [Ignavibacteria bacterium]
MNYNIVSNWDMSRRWESNWLQFVSEDYNFGKSKVKELSCVEFMWDGVTGALDGKIYFVVTNNQISQRVLKVVEINTESNLANSYYLSIFFPSFEYFKIIYEPNGTVAGRLTIGVLYR